ncbi:MAG: metal ABC transporter permease [Planctomycetota bacterium]
MTHLLELLYDGATWVLKFALPFEWASSDYMLTPMLAALLIMPLAAAIGVVVVNGRMVFFTSAVAHSAFTGVAVGVLMSTNPTNAMIAFGIVLAVLMTWLDRSSKVPFDSLVGVIQTLSVAAGLVIVSAFNYQRLDSFLYGSLLWASKADLARLLFISFAVLAMLYYSYNRLLMIGLSRSLAKAWGINTAFYEYLFSAITALVVMVGIQTIGVLLIAAAIVIPAVAGRNFAWSAGSMIWTSTAIALVSGILGVALSYHWNSIAGATIVLVAGVFFVVSYVWRLLRFTH